MEQILSDFFEYYGEPSFTNKVPYELIEKYSEFFMGRDDELDIILLLWKKYGFAGFGDGLFWLVNPEEYEIKSVA